MTGVKGKSGRKKITAPTKPVSFRFNEVKYKQFCFWCEHDHRTPREVICELMDHHVLECIAIKQTVDRVRAVDIARRIIEQDLKRQALDNRMDALLSERKKEGSE